MTDEINLVGNAPDRTLDGGIFPFSARANAREGIFSDVLATVLQCEPRTAVAEEGKDSRFEWQETTFKERFIEVLNGESDWETKVMVAGSTVDPQEVWEIFDAKYIASTQGGNPIVAPFNPEVPKRIRPYNSNQWGTWYRLLMTERRGEDLVFDPDDIHDKFRNRLNDLEPSNVFERMAVSIVETFEEPVESDGDRTAPLRPYIDESAENFRTDLAAWLENDVESASDWLRGAQDLIAIHFFMYYVQVAVNLREEWEQFINGNEYSPEVISIPFGIESEAAGLGRDFVKIWEGERGAEFSVKQDIYDSFARLAVLRILNESLEDKKGTPNYQVTLTEALQLMDAESRKTAIEAIYDHLDCEPPEGSSQSNLITAAEDLVSAIDRYYQGPDDSAPFTMGIRGVKRLDDADVRFLTLESGRPSFRFQMGDETLAFMARIFASDEERTGNELALKRFIRYLSARGFELDERSGKAAKASLTSMGLLRQESDSGDSVNVRSY